MFLTTITMVLMTTTCVVDECESVPTRHTAKGMCSMHYQRWKKYGSTDLPPRPSLTERLVARFRVGFGDLCWPWTGKAEARGYGTLLVGGRALAAHRLVYELFLGPVPEGLELDHLCRNPNCVRPDHLEPVTHAENTRRGRGGWNSLEKTHCPKGHEYATGNTYMVRGKNGNPYRVCRQCKLDSWAERTARGWRRPQQSHSPTCS
jgi:hypothetical protein